MPRVVRYTDKDIKAKHSLKEYVQLPYLCDCGKRFRTYKEWSEHRIDVATVSVNRTEKD